MMNGFTHISLAKPRTVGERLRAARLRRKITLAELEARSKVRASFVEAIERSRFELLPATVYCLGFIRSICSSLELPAERFVPDFRAEHSFWLKRHSLQTIDHEKLIRAHRPRFTVTPKLIAFASASLTVLLVSSYIYFQLATFLAPPALTILTPAEEAKVLQNRVTVVGQTSPGATVSINRELVVPGAQGRFEEEIVLSPGVNELEVTAQTRFNRKTSKMIKVLRERSEARNDNDPPASS